MELSFKLGRKTPITLHNKLIHVYSLLHLYTYLYYAFDFLYEFNVISFFKVKPEEFLYVYRTL